MAALRRYTLFVCAVFLAACLLFLLCERFDNKYRLTNTTDGSVAAESDAFSAGGQDRMVFLVHGWEIYRGQLLTPGDFALATAPTPSEIISIGDIDAFEGAGVSGDVHGSASYRLVLDLPATPAAYAIALPEIFSACRVWINGVEVAAFGDASPDAYRPETGETLVSFLARERVELLIAASDYSHIYSGLVYPPAFGTPQDVSRLMSARLLLRAAACTLALLLGAFFLISGILTQKNRLMLLFAALALCYVPDFPSL